MPSVGPIFGYRTHELFVEYPRRGVADLLTKIADHTMGGNADFLGGRQINRATPFSIYYGGLLALYPAANWACRNGGTMKGDFI